MMNEMEGMELGHEHGSGQLAGIDPACPWNRCAGEVSHFEPQVRRYPKDMSPCRRRPPTAIR